MKRKEVKGQKISEAISALVSIIGQRDIKEIFILSCQLGFINSKKSSIVAFLGELKPRKSAFEISWPLVLHNFRWILNSNWSLLLNKNSLNFPIPNEWIKLGRKVILFAPAYESLSKDIYRNGRNNDFEGALNLNNVRQTHWIFAKF